MNSKKSFVLGFGTACLCLIIAYNAVVGIGILQGKMSTERKIKVIENLVNKKFVDDVDNDELEEYLYAGYVSGLNDKYSTYMTAEQFKSFKEELKGSYSGIGIRVTFSEDKKLFVDGVYDGSPAQKAGICEGDIISVAGDIEITDEESYLKAIEFIKSAKDDFVVKGMHENGEEYSVNVTNEAIDVPTVSCCMAEGNIGYIKISEFESNTAEQFKAAVKELNGMKGLVLDLRDNPGGFLTVVNEIADEILPEGTITYVEYKDGSKEYYKSDEKCMDIPIAVVVNGSSASASEVLTGAIKDFGAGKIVGSKTFGKGVVQDTFSLSDGSAVKLTVAKYYTPNGVCIHDKGIEPDVKADAPEGFKPSAISSSKAEIDVSADPQLKAAFDTVKNPS